MVPLARLLFLLVLAAGISGCASTGSTGKPKDDERVSSIPWAKPESWQGQGQFGGMFQQGR